MRQPSGGWQQADALSAPAGASVQCAPWAPLTRRPSMSPGSDPPGLGPGHPADRQGRVRRDRRLRLPRCIRWPAHGGVDGDDLATLDFDRVDQVNGPDRGRRCRARRHAPGRRPRPEPADWGWTARSRASAPGRRLPRPDLQDDRLPVGTAEFWPGVRVPLAPFCGEMGWRRPAPALDHPARPPRRQHGHPPPRRRGRRCSCRSSCRARFSHRRRSRHAGRRRGLRHGDRDADAGLVRLTVRKDLT